MDFKTTNKRLSQASCQSCRVQHDAELYAKNATAEGPGKVESISCRHRQSENKDELQNNRVKTPDETVNWLAE